MTDKFELLCMGISQVHKKIQKIKKMHMNSFGLKGTHVMCIYFLSRAESGLTAAELCDLCGEDKAGISRILADLESQDLISYAQNLARPCICPNDSSPDSGNTACSAYASVDSGNTASPANASVDSGKTAYSANAPEKSGAGKPDRRKYRARAFLTDAGRTKAAIINRWVKEAVNLGSLGISPEDEEIFYRVLFHISDNLNEAIKYTENEYEKA